MSIPMIDFSEPDAASKEFEQSLINLGFSQIKNYGIDHTLLNKVFDASLAFFTGDASTKQRCAYQSAKENFGYQGLLEENLDPEAPADLKQTFTMRNILNQPPEASRWPSESFKNIMQAFYKNALESSYTLMRGLAKCLNIEEAFFVRVHDGENISLRLLYYPESDAENLLENQLGAGAHTDYGFLTLLFQNTIGGLQVLDKHNQWLDVAPTEGATVINSGDLLERWTNGLYRSTLHRVKPPQQTRLSVAFFLDPASDTEITPLPSCTKGTIARYPTVTAAEHIQQKLEATHKARFKR